MDIIEVFNLGSKLGQAENVLSIDNDLVLIEDPKLSFSYDHPFKIDMAVTVMCLRGEMRGSVNLKPYRATDSSMTIILPGQVLQYEYISPDFSGLFSLMSQRFIDGLGLGNQFSTFIWVKDNPSVLLNKEELEAMKNCFGMISRVLSIKEHPYRLEITQNLIRAFFYGAGYYFYNAIKNDRGNSRNEILVTNFLRLVVKHYKEHRELAFYADKLCITPKYMSSVIKQTSNKTAGSWIDGYVIMEAKALLKSTNMTIQQISDELNFPSQSFFGKYFKRLEGVSPKEYRKK